MSSGKRTMTKKQTLMLKAMLSNLEHALSNKNDIQSDLALDLANFLKVEGHVAKSSQFVKPENEEKRKKGNVHGNSAIHRSNLGDSDKRNSHTKAA